MAVSVVLDASIVYVNERLEALQVPCVLHADAQFIRGVVYASNMSAITQGGLHVLTCKVEGEDVHEAHADICLEVGGDRRGRHWVGDMIYGGLWTYETTYCGRRHKTCSPQA